MNNPKITNVLLIALIALNSLFLLGWAVSSHHRHHEMCMRGNFRMHHGHGGGWAFHRGRGAYGEDNFRGFRHGHHRNFGEMRNSSMSGGI
jgi:hypothetical protein